MKTIISQYSFWLFFSLVLMLGCKGSKTVTDPKATLENEIQKASNNLERFYRLNIGDFMYFSYTNGDSANIERALVNDGQDSVIRMIRPVGDKNKDGYWLFDYTCTTNLPETPLVQFFQQIEQISRDSLIAYVYNPEVKVPVEALVNNQLAKAIDLAEVKKNKPLKTVIYVKVDAKTFKYEEALKPYNFSKSEDETFLSQVVLIGLSGHKEQAIFYDTEKVKTSSLTNFQRRLVRFDPGIMMLEDEE